MSAADSERELWEASGQYVRGEISAERLAQIELPSTLSHKDATLAVAAWGMRWSIIPMIIILIILTLVLTVITFILTQNVFSFALLSGLILPLLASRPLISYLFPPDDKFYQAKAQRIQRKRNKKKKTNPSTLF